MFGEASKNPCDLRGRLPFSQDDFRHAIAQRAVMVDFSESEIFEGQMAEASDGVVGREFAFADLLEKFADGFGVQSSIRQSAFSRGILD